MPKRQDIIQVQPLGEQVKIFTFHVSSSQHKLKPAKQRKNASWANKVVQQVQRQEEQQWEQEFGRTQITVQELINPQDVDAKILLFEPAWKVHANEADRS